MISAVAIFPFQKAKPKPPPDGLVVGAFGGFRL
jgi:hypothetical protein